ncbi:hypothetical protein EDD18DRAFT_1111000 [Armillaria luteobubalina]|uniref:DUF6535 domain-containing protein n=1 Tax=Armillaria luteobubalina TaxID=153913 RepID=A0AA39TFW9_9AGAR|nr:hypothetical protein EDD18DRAFT_1111000 [Armillaria luteobubalina]
MPSDIQDEASHDPALNVDSGIRVTDPLNTPIPTQTPLDTPEIFLNSAHDDSTTGERMSPMTEEVPTTRRAGTRHPSVFGLSQQGAGSEGMPTGDFRAFAPKPPFEEAGPTSSVWYTYLGKIQDLETDLVAEQRGELNIILVFSGLFSAVITAFYMKSLENLAPDYQQVAALLLLDQINIQRALANGTSLDNIITSNADPTGDSFVPDQTDYGIYCLWVDLSYPQSFNCLFRHSYK